jgi:hypothetical protein
MSIYNTKTYWTLMNINFHIVNKICLLYWESKISAQNSDHSRPGSRTRNAHFIINLSFPNTHKMHLAIMKVYRVNAITKANVLNKVNDEVYDMFKIYLHTKFHVAAFNISLLVTDKLQKVKTIHSSHIWVYPIPQKYSVIWLATVTKSITTDYLTSSESTTFTLLIVKH